MAAQKPGELKVFCFFFSKKKRLLAFSNHPRVR